MKVRKAKNFRREISAGAVIFHNGKKREYLLLHYVSERDYWGLPKGHVELEKGEYLESTALREIEEETGLRRDDLELVADFKEKVHYFFREGATLISKDVFYFLAQAKKKNIRLSSEHKGFEWLPYGKALERMTYNKKILESAENFLNEKYGIQNPTLF